MLASDYNRAAVAHKRQGNYAEAEACYQRALEIDPSCAEAQFNLGLLCRDLGRVSEAISCFQQTLATRPDVLPAYFELTSALSRAGRDDEATRVGASAVQLAPREPESHFRLANAYYESQAWQESVRAYESAIALRPDWPAPHVNLGNAFRESGQLDRACQCCIRAIELDPKLAAAHLNLGRVYRLWGKSSEAAACYQQAIDLEPTLWQAHLNLGLLYSEVDRPEAALQCVEVAVALRPRIARCHADRGRVLVNINRRDDAVAAFQTALQLDRKDAEPAVELGKLLYESGDLTGAIGYFEHARQMAPADPLHALRLSAACPLVFGSTAEMRDYRTRLEETAASLEDCELDVEPARIAGILTSVPFALQYISGNLRTVYEKFASVYRRFFLELQARRSWAGSGSGRSRPRVAIVVTRHHERAFNRLFRETVERIDPRQFEISLVCASQGAGTIRQALTCDHISILELAARFDLAAARIAEAAFDILYYWEVGSDPWNYFLPFLRLAPVQCTSWGIQVTSGIPNLDYYLSSRAVEASNAQQHYSESLLLADSLLSYQTPTQLPAGTDQCLSWQPPADARLYGCLQRPSKIHPDFDEAIGNILRKDERGRVLLLQDPHGMAAQRLRLRIKQRLPDVADRVELLPQQSWDEYLRVVARCDVVLDPIYFGGVTSTYEALSLNKPVISLPTDQQRGRYTAACLRRLDLQECIAASWTDYVELAVELAVHEERRRSVSQRICSRKPELFADKLSVVDHERFFHEMLSQVR